MEFIKIPVLRGFEEIKNLYGLLGLHKVHICGGYVRYMGSPNPDPFPPKDIDLYCEDEDSFINIYNEFDRFGLKRVGQSAIAIKYEIPNKEHLLYTPVRLHLVKPIKVEGERFVTCGSLEDILRSFDFTIVRCGLLNEHTILADPLFTAHEQTKTLEVRHIGSTAAILHHMFRYVKKGYHTPAPHQIRDILDRYKNSVLRKRTLLLGEKKKGLQVEIELDEDDSFLWDYLLEEEENELRNIDQK
jgi:hypothetical protein